ncbi:MAG: class I SAM-dependent methyltransferase [Acidobacteria bacterium]|nr:class I SAM-dependent methyltransferase [Acidobacteriota bacterium]
MTVQELIASPPKLHIAGQGAPTDTWKLSDEELLFIDRAVDQNTRTIETGAGCSTVLFALKGADHTAIMPDRELADRILEYCAERRICTSGLKFIIDKSESALPRIQETDFQLALIDGRHGFPQPFLDYYYLASLLKPGGYLIVDDLHIWTCETLMQYLVEDNINWRLIHESLGGCAFKKLGGDSQDSDYGGQTYVRRRSRQFSSLAKARYLVHLLKRRNYGLFRSTLRLGIQSAVAGRFGDRGRR